MTNKNVENYKKMLFSFYCQNFPKIKTNLSKSSVNCYINLVAVPPLYVRRTNFIVAFVLSKREKYFLIINEVLRTFYSD